MRISTVKLRNFRAFGESSTISLTEMPVIIGRNDAGKSSILYAISLFFDKHDLESTDFHMQGGADDPIQVEIGFGQLSDEAKSMLGGKNLVSSTG